MHMLTAMAAAITSVEFGTLVSSRACMTPRAKTTGCSRTYVLIVTRVRRPCEQCGSR